MCQSAVTCLPLSQVNVVVSLRNKSSEDLLNISLLQSMIWLREFQGQQVAMTHQSNQKNMVTEQRNK